MSTYTEKTFAIVAPNTNTDAYTVPTSNSATITGLQATNKTATTSYITVKFYDNSATTAFEYVANVSLPGYSTLGLLAGKYVLESGDKVQVQASASSSIVVVGSVVERTP